MPEVWVQRKDRRQVDFRIKQDGYVFRKRSTIESRQIDKIARQDIDPYWISDGQEVQRTEVCSEDSVSEKEK